MRNNDTIKAVLIGLLLGVVGASAAQTEVKGKVRVDVYTTMAGTLVSDLTNNLAYPNSPTYTVFSPNAEYPWDETDPAGSLIPHNLMDNYAIRMSGFLTAPDEGDWVFWISSDDQSALFLSTDDNPANAVEVAREPNWARQRYYFFTRDATPVFPTGDTINNGGEGLGCTLQTSGQYSGYVKCANNTNPVHLKKGEKRAFVYLGKEGGGDDDWSIWATTNKNPYATLQTDFPGYPGADAVPSDPALRPYPLHGDWISTLQSDTPSISLEPADQTGTVGRTFAFTGGIEPSGTSGVYTYQWFINGTPVTDATNSVYNSATVDPAAPIYATKAMNGDKYKFEATPENGPKLTSREAVLTVVDDTVPPQIQEVVTYESGKGLRLKFNEPMNDTAFQPGNYTISGGVTVTGVVPQNPAAAPTDDLLTVVLATSQQTPDTDYTLTMKPDVKDIAGNAVTNKTLTFHTWKVQSGKVGYGVWYGSPSIDDLKSEISDGVLPYYGYGLDQALSPVNILNNAGADFVSGGRLQFLFKPKQTGDYVFWMATDDAGDLYLSTDENPANAKLIAQEPTWNNSGDWVAPNDPANTPNNIQRNRPNCGTIDPDTGPQPDCDNRSDQFMDTEWATKDNNGKAKITLTAGNKYYMEVLEHEGGGGDNMGVTFTLAGSPPPTNGQTELKGDLIEWLAPVSTTAAAGGIKSWQYTGGKLVITYDGTLNSTTSLATPFAPVQGATSPYSADPTGAAAFFQAK